MRPAGRRVLEELLRLTLERLATRGAFVPKGRTRAAASSIRSSAIAQAVA